MSYRRMFVNGTRVCLAVALVAVCHARTHAQGMSGGGGGGSSSSGSTATAIGGGFTGGGGSTGSTATTTASGFTGSAGSGSNTSSTGRTGGASGTSTTVPTAVNILQPTYISPYGAGLVNTSGQATSTKAFGQPLYSVFSTATTSATNVSTTSFTGGSGGGLSSANTGGGVGFGYNSYGLGRTYNYVAVPGDTLPIVNHTNPQLQSTIADVLRRSVTFNALTPLKVKVNANTVIIDGTVATAKEKRLVEGMIRMTPGVRTVVNNLQVAETLPIPKTAALGADR
jgi:hypothetical protein